MYCRFTLVVVFVLVLLCFVCIVCIVMCPSRQGRTAVYVADFLEVKYTNQIHVKKQATVNDESLV